MRRGRAALIGGRPRSCPRRSASRVLLLRLARPKGACGQATRCAEALTEELGVGSWPRSIFNSQRPTPPKWVLLGVGDWELAVDADRWRQLARRLCGAVLVERVSEIPRDRVGALVLDLPPLHHVEQLAVAQER